MLGQPTILVGEDVDPYVRGLSYDGTERFVYRLGGYPRDIAAVDIDGDGRPEILEGGTDAEVAVHDRRGNTLWHERFPGKATPDIEAVHAGELTADPGREVVAGSFDFGRGEGGQVRVFTSDGRQLWSDRTPGPVGTVLATDLDDDNAGDLLVANSGPGLDGLGSQIARYAGNGTALWKTATPPSISGPAIGTLEVNGDGVEDVILLTLPFGQSFVLAYDGATGGELWRFAPRSIGQWLDVRDDLDDGITFGDMQGRIFRLAVETGQPVWERRIDGVSRDGAWTIDANGDGIRDIATAGDSGIVHLISGADGSDLWTRGLDGEERGLRVASISGTERTRIAVGSYTNTNGARSGVYFFDPLDGTRTARFETEGHVLDIEPVDVNGDGNQEALTAAGLQIHAIDINDSELDPDPTTTPTSSPSPTQSPEPETTTVTFTDSSAESGQYSDETLFEAHLNGRDGAPLGGQELSFELTGAESSRSFTATTDENGVASVTPRLEEAPGPYQLTVRYVGDDDRVGSADTSTYIVDKEDTDLELTVEGAGNKRTVIARLTDRDTSTDGIAGRTVEFYADGDLIGSAITGDDGVATLKPPSRYRGGKHDFEARFTGDDHYRSSSGHRNV
jgi:outer membrane protein assembly factor BamB